MIRHFAIPLVFSTGVASLGPAQEPATPFVELIPAVVTITTISSNGTPAFGSGVLLDGAGIVATAYHVVAGADSAELHLGTGEILDIEGVIEADQEKDFALVRVAGFGLPTVRLGNSDSLAVGQRLIAISAPLGLSATISDGLLSNIRIVEGTKIFQISIPVSPGSSGGPVFNEDGEVVALVVSGIRGGGAENLNFALPINYVRGALALAAAKTPQPLSTLAVSDGSDGHPAFLGDESTLVVNDGLDLDWGALDGLSFYYEYKEGDWRYRRTVSYNMSLDEHDDPILIRQLAQDVRVHMSGRGTRDAARESIRTEYDVLTGASKTNGGRTALIAELVSASFTLALNGPRSYLTIDGARVPLQLPWAPSR